LAAGALSQWLQVVPGSIVVSPANFAACEVPHQLRLARAASAFTVIRVAAGYVR
jgi:hypothetical protein